MYWSNAKAGRNVIGRAENMPEHQSTVMLLAESCFYFVMFSVIKVYRSF